MQICRSKFHETHLATLMEAIVDQIFDRIHFATFCKIAKFTAFKKEFRSGNSHSICVHVYISSCKQ